jgi:LmbE family N-acetylglucosaminyl deacetylase
VTRVPHSSRPGVTRHTLLAVFAHPDDESIACGGLLAWCAHEGARVILLCATHGELGHPPDDSAHGLTGLADTATRMAALKERRGDELACAADHLGIDEMRILGYPDGMLPWLPDGALAAAVHDVLDALHPQVVVTFGADGLYWHPDHVAVHQAVRTAVASLDVAAPALFYVTMPPGQMRQVVERAAARVAVGATRPLRRTDVLGIDNPDAFGDAAEPPTLVLETGAFAARKLAAIRCHRTQTAGGPFDALGDADAAVILGLEHYHRADVGSQAPVFIERLTGAHDVER